jgi:hypothetical protein
VCACNSNYWEAEVGESQFEATLGRRSFFLKGDLIRNKKCWSVTQSVEQLPSKCKALSSNQSTATKREEGREGGRESEREKTETRPRIVGHRQQE